MCKSINCLVWEQVLFTEDLCFFSIFVVAVGGGDGKSFSF